MPSRFAFTTPSIISVLIIGLLLAVTEAHAATTYTFDTAVTGSQAWTTTTNWTPNTGYPNLTTDIGIINRSASTGDLNLTTPGTATTIQQLTLTSGASSALTLTLGNNLSLNSGTQSIFTNSISASQLVFDLKSYTFDTAAGTGTAGPFVRSTGLQYFTAKDTSAGGNGTITFGLYSQSNGRVEIQNNVTLRVTNTAAFGPVTTAYTAFSSGSTMWVDTTVNTGTINFITAASGGINSNYGNLIIGNTTTGHATSLLVQGYSSKKSMTVLGNMTIGQNSTIALGYNANAINSVFVGGNWTDYGGATGYAGRTDAFSTNSTISFNGGSSQHTASINRTLTANIDGKVTNFEIGDGTTAGNIKLVNASSTVGALYTAGSMTVRGGSKLDLDHSTTTGSVASLRAGSIIVGAVGNAATIATSFGTNSGFGVADATLGGTGNLTLNSYNLELNFDGTSWTNGTNLVLFTYTGTFSGTASLGTITFNTGSWTYGGITTSGGIVQLTNLSAVPIPEPSSAALLLGAFGGLVVWTVRRKKIL